MVCHSGVVSLLELLKFDAREFVGIARQISWLETVAAEIKRKHPQHSQHMFAPEILTEVPSVFGGLKNALGALYLDSAEDQVARIIQNVANGATAIEIANGLGELQNRIEDQLGRRLFYQLDPRTASYFYNANPFGDKVLAAFPSAAHDISEAGKCYACDRFDATVYHLSRALECPMKCLARTMNIKYASTWAGYILQIDKRLKNSRLRISRQRRVFLSNASALLWSVKDAWRNDAAHLGKEYGPDQTKKIFDSTKAFMEHLATGLKERTN